MREKKLTKFVRYALLLLLACLYVVPILMMVLGSVKSSGEVLAFDLSLPEKFLWENYTYVIENGHIFRGYGNSLFMTSIATIVSITLGAFTGIVLSRRNERFTRCVYYYFIFGLTITFQTASTFYLLKLLNIYGSFFAVICIYIALRTPFTVMTFASFVKGVPREIDEAAIVDGCNPFQMVFRILIPIMKPIMITNLILTAISVWNNFMIPLFYLTKSSKWPVTLAIYNFYGQYARDWQYVFAALTLTVAPMIILFLCLQKYIVGGMTSGAVKG